MRWIMMAAMLSLAACGGRVARPVQVEKSFDELLSCAHLTGEYDVNIKRLAELTGEKDDRLRNNVGLLISSPLFLDFSGTLKAEAQAILARNERLRALMADKGCSAADSPDHTTGDKPSNSAPDSNQDD